MKVFLLGILCLNLSCVIAQNIDQSSISSGSIDTIDGEWMMNATVGEVFVQEYKHGFHLLTEGFEQPLFYQRWVDVQTTEPLKISFYPNPSMDQIQFENWKGLALMLELYDLQGRLVKTVQLEEVSGLVDISFLEQGNYFLKVKDAAHIYQVFKLVKYE